MNKLEIKNVSKTFGGLRALNHVSVDLKKGEILGLIGPNGAGKTTLFNVITGFLQPDEGEVLFKGIDITNSLPNHICLLGICRTFQIVKPFEEMTVLDNVMIGAFNRTNNRRDAQKRAMEILDFIGLSEQGEKMGNLLFSLVNLAQKWGLNAEHLLRGTNQRFIESLEEMEGELKSSRIESEPSTPHVMSRFWGKAKIKKG